MRKIKFKIDENNKIIGIYSNITIVYNDLHISSLNTGGNGALIADSGIELMFDTENKQITGLSGYIGDLSRLKSSNITVNKSDGYCVLNIDNDEEYFPSIAYTFDFDNTVKYDKNKNILLFGDYKPKLKIYKMFKNAYVQLEGNELKSIIITDISLNITKEITDKIF